MIRTVRGDRTLAPGPVLIHEHVQIDLSHNKGPATVLGPQHVDDIVADLLAAKRQYGLVAVGELSVPGSGRAPAILRQVSEATDIDIVCATGFYWEPVAETVAAAAVEDLRAIMVQEIETGVAGTDVRCGVIKIGTDVGAPGAVFERMFVAAAQASLATGAAIITHTSAPEQAPWQVATLLGAGARPGRVLISHLHTAQDEALIWDTLAAGVSIGFDQIGFAKGPCYDKIADLTVAVCERGFAGQLLLSSDMARPERFVRRGGTSYATVFSHFVPKLAARGLDAATIKVLLEDNPRRLLTMG